MQESFIPIADSIFEMLKDIHNGFYFDCGCNDSVQQSNTLRLEKELGWKGVLVDASQIAMNRSIENRSHENIFVTAALVEPKDEGRTIFGDFNGHLMASIGGKRLKGISPISIGVLGRTIKTIYDLLEGQPIDFMSVDLEGEELAALKGLGECRPKFLCVELNGNGCNDGTHPVIQYLRTIGYSKAKNLSCFTKENNPHWDGSHQDWWFTS